MSRGHWTQTCLMSVHNCPIYFMISILFNNRTHRFNIRIDHETNRMSLSEHRTDYFQFDIHWMRCAFLEITCYFHAINVMLYIMRRTRDFSGLF